MKERIEGAGGEVTEAGSGDGPTVIAGPWEEIADDREAAPLGDSPTRSGVFARFEEAGDGWELATYDEELQEVGRLGPGAGLVAALEGPGEEPVWVVTGTDEEGTDAAAAALSSEGLANRFAVAIAADGEPSGLPQP